MDWMLLPLKRYADFSGRSRRKEYWMFTLLFVLAIVGMAIVTGTLGAFSVPEPTALFIVPIGLLILALFVPTLAVQVRRFHDQDKSGWYVLLGLIPYVGGIVVLVFMCIEGTRGANRLGPDPKELGSQALR